MLLEKYLQEGTYNYKIYAHFVKNGNNHIVATEFNPTGKESDFFILYQKEDKILNSHGDLCATIKNDKIEFVEL